jgi:hypothetical protein
MEPNNKRYDEEDEGMTKQYIAKVTDNKEITNIINTGLEESKNETIYLMSNGKIVQIIHKDYKEEVENEGYWIAMIFEYGHRVEA